MTGLGDAEESGRDIVLCLQGNRFGVEASWRDFQGNTGVGKTVPLTADTGLFWFFTMIGFCENSCAPWRRGNGFTCSS